MRGILRIETRGQKQQHDCGGTKSTSIGPR